MTEQGDFQQATSIQRSWAVPGLELVVAVVSGWIAWAAWRHGTHTLWFTPDDGAPGFRSTHYSGSWILLASVMAVVALAGAIDLIRRLVAR